MRMSGVSLVSLGESLIVPTIVRGALMTAANENASKSAEDVRVAATELV